MASQSPWSKSPVPIIGGDWVRCRSWSQEALGGHEEKPSSSSFQPFHTWGWVPRRPWGEDAERGEAPLGLDRGGEGDDFGVGEILLLATLDMKRCWPTSHSTSSVSVVSSRPRSRSRASFMPSLEWSLPPRPLAMSWKSADVLIDRKASGGS